MECISQLECELATSENKLAIVRKKLKSLLDYDSNSLIKKEIIKILEIC